MTINNHFEAVKAINSNESEKQNREPLKDISNQIRTPDISRKKLKITKQKQRLLFLIQ